jgi:hypothetical protein
MSGRTFARVLLAVIVIGGAIMLGVGAYNAGVSQGLAHSGAVSAVPGGYPVTPYIGWGYGWGHGFGFGIFGFLGTILFLFLVFGLVRAAFGGGRGWGPGGRRGWYGGEGGMGHGGFDERARRFHEELHRSTDSDVAGDRSRPSGDRPIA